MTDLPDEVDVDGQVDAKGVRFIGKAKRQPDGTWRALADVGGALCLVECSVSLVNPDFDLDTMDRDALLAEVKKLRAGVRQHRDSSGHDLCWWTPELWGLLPEAPLRLPVVPAWPEFMQSARHTGRPWTTVNLPQKDVREETEMENMVIPADQARVNVTWAGQNGDLPQLVSNDAADGDIKQWLTETIRTGGVPGIAADPAVNFADFIVERFKATDDVPYNRIVVRPKTPFGG